MPTPPRIWSSAAPLLKVRQMSSPSRRTILTASVLVGLGIHRTASAAEIAASLTKPGTPDAARFFDETESWLFTNCSAYAVPRVEWSKQWAYTAAGAFTDTTMLSTTIPASYGPAYAAARAALNAMDPQRIFSSPLLDQVLP